MKAAYCLILCISLVMAHTFRPGHSAAPGVQLDSKEDVPKPPTPKADRPEPPPPPPPPAPPPPPPPPPPPRPPASPTPKPHVPKIGSGASHDTTTYIPSAVDTSTPAPTPEQSPSEAPQSGATTSGS